MNWRWAFLVLLAASARWTMAAQITVPIYIEDSHAGSFYWLAEHLDLDEECTLIHFDAHSDASAIFDSDKLRERLRRVASLEERRQLLERWRASGVIQCFNWIEPLMPAPIARVIWVHRGDQQKAIDQLDGHLEAAPRGSGSFRQRYQTADLAALPARLRAGEPVIVTIDLDYFADVPANLRAKEFERVWEFVTQCRNLRAVTFAISRPYLTSDEQADDLVRLALDAAFSWPTAAIQFEPFAKVGNDRSLRAREFATRHEAVPEFKLANASEELRALLLANRDRMAVQTETAGWDKQLNDWQEATPKIRLAVKDHDPSTDGIWRVPTSEAAEIQLETEPWDAAVQRIEWIALTPVYTRCNLTAKSANEIGFASGAPPRPRWREVKLPRTDQTLSLDVARRATATEIGAIRVKARAEINGHVRETAPIEVRRFAGEGFRAAITEQFGLPYLFGSGELTDRGNDGPETGFGADCANFLVYALRREGRAVPWSNPKQLRKYLEPVAQNIGAGEAAIADSDLAHGLIVHLGSHVAVVMEDRPPLGVLDGNDLVAHQLEGVPEMLSLGQLLAERKGKRFDLLRVPDSFNTADLVVGGDVMLGRTIGAQIEQGLDPLEGIRVRLERASANLINLESVISDKGIATANKRYCFRAPLDAVRVLTEGLINVVSLANNHAADFGSEALLDSIARLRAGEVVTLGAGENAYAPHFFATRTGTKVALLALDDVDEPAIDLSVASARNRDRVAASLAQARVGAAFLLCFVHWGDENTSRVTDRQRELARWLIDHGADAVVGSHPHCLQPFDSYHGHPIIYSLGNLVFDGAPKVPGWNRGQLLEIDLSRTGARPALRLVPVQLDARGFPQVAGGEDDRTGGKTFATAGAAFSRNRVQGDSKNR